MGLKPTDSSVLVDVFHIPIISPTLFLISRLRRLTSPSWGPRLVSHLRCQSTTHHLCLHHCFPHLRQICGSNYAFSSVSSVTQSCLTLWDPVDCSMPGLPVQHQLTELAQTHVHWVGDAIQPSHPLLSPSPAFNLSQHQGLFQWVSFSHQVAKVLEFQLQHQSFQWTVRTDFL